ncbi:methylenetetrahydrofolate reductase [Desulfovibrio legallii]|jgi:methylenetetrahydrofolate reductase (NADPH)|uniref:Methylenetetrahydrofolate reductase n=1 Tax=Desulfovibrio legallii TaxID=571438 RepID=A0A1G7P3I2_9BACT|nr:methylenetetrahydrofolate reductase [Desulfovibrio legallii]SDF80784.1 5,10-methylenetetrahydrofolate reductase (NAD(P)) [Desulfovibrio legallii]
MNIGRKIRAVGAPFCSLEFFPPADAAQLPAFYATVERLRALDPLFVSVTYGAGGARQQNTLTVTAELARRGFTAMAHLTCVGAEPESIAGFLQALRAAGVDNVLALRGDPPANRPEDKPWDWSRAHFHHAADLVAFARQREPGMGIGVAAYPAPHPESPSFAEDRRRTAEKLRAGADFALTQLFFDAREYEDLVARLRAQGIAIPIVPGILPIQSFDSLRRVLALCGANIPGKLYLDLEAADARGGAQAVREVGLAFAVRQIRRLLESGAPGVHLYTLNKADLCLRLAQETGLSHDKACAPSS